MNITMGLPRLQAAALAQINQLQLILGGHAHLCKTHNTAVCVAQPNICS